MITKAALLEDLGRWGVYPPRRGGGAIFKKKIRPRGQPGPPRGGGVLG